MSLSDWWLGEGVYICYTSTKKRKTVSKRGTFLKGQSTTRAVESLILYKCSGQLIQFQLTQFQVKSNLPTLMSIYSGGSLFSLSTIIILVQVQGGARNFLAIFKFFDACQLVKSLFVILNDTNKYGASEKEQDTSCRQGLWNA